MPDLSMCGNASCPLKANCYRSEASGTRPNDRWQSWIAFRWVKSADGEVVCFNQLPMHRGWETERIERAAIRHDDRVWDVPQPGRHHDVVRLIAEQAPQSLPVGGGSDQGFVTNLGRFVGRIEGGLIALAAKQTEALKWGPSLFSEDLW